MTDKIKRFIYVDSKGHVTFREVGNASKSGDYLQAIDLATGGVKTFRTDRILEHVTDTADVLERVQHWQSQYTRKSESDRPGGRRAINGVPEVCFTGFKAADKTRLTELAVASGYMVRGAVSVSLEVLCYGYNAGPSKMQQARDMGILILTEPQFLAFKDSGEIPIEADHG